jgi:hypothetical protein
MSGFGYEHERRQAVDWSLKRKRLRFQRSSILVHRVRLAHCMEKVAHPHVDRNKHTRDKQFVGLDIALNIRRGDKRE